MEVSANSTGAVAEVEAAGAGGSGDIHSSVSEYYGKILSSTNDLKTNACCTSSFVSDPEVASALSHIHRDVSNRYYGCGLVIPELLHGLKVLDLGCGAGRDCFLLSQLVGQDGYVVGVDMTKEQLDVANGSLDWHMREFGYERSNVEFKLGFIEQLDQLGLEPNSFDLIVSNCVINVSITRQLTQRKNSLVLQ